MIRGYFARTNGRRRPFVSAVLDFSTLDKRERPVQFLVDTGADRTVLAPRDASRLGLDLDALDEGIPSTGVGGRTRTRTVAVVLTMDDFSTPLTLTILATPPEQRSLPIPSLLGRDILSRFALFVEERTGRVLLLTPDEADRLNLPPSA